MKTLPNDSAYAIAYEEKKWGSEDQIKRVKYGLTKREYFAAMAMQGLLAGSYDSMAMGCKSVAEGAVSHADALIAELNNATGEKEEQP